MLHFIPLLVPFLPANAGGPRRKRRKGKTEEKPERGKIFEGLEFYLVIRRLGVSRKSRCCLMKSARQIILGRPSHKAAIPNDEVGYYHVYKRCVRGAFLIRGGVADRIGFDQRRQWVQAHQGWERPAARSGATNRGGFPPNWPRSSNVSTVREATGWTSSTRYHSVEIRRRTAQSPSAASAAHGSSVDTGDRHLARALPIDLQWPTVPPRSALSSLPIPSTSPPVVDWHRLLTLLQPHRGGQGDHPSKSNQWLVVLPC